MRAALCVCRDDGAERGTPMEAKHAVAGRQANEKAERRATAAAHPANRRLAAVVGRRLGFRGRLVLERALGLVVAFSACSAAGR